MTGVKQGGMMSSLQIEEFLTYLRTQDRAETTIKGYARDLAKFITWFEQTTGRRPAPANVTPLDVREYRQYLQTVKRMKPASINRRLAALRGYFHWACDTGLAATNPATTIKMIEQVEQKIRWLEREETYALLRAAREAIQLAEAKGLKASTGLAKRNAAILSLLLHGLRVSEVCALQLEDVTLNERSGQVVVYFGKGRKYREVPLNLDARKAIKTWLAVRPPEAGSRLFVGRRDNALRPRAVQRVLDKLARAANLDPVQVTPHACRHTFGKNLVNAGESLDRVAVLMGHKNLDTTAIYTTPSQADLAAAVERIAWGD